MEITKCPVCGMDVRIVRRGDGAAAHYEPLPLEEAAAIPNPCPPALADFLRVSRKGKKTVALVGAAFNTGTWAPFGDEGVEIWTLNEIHGEHWVEEEHVTAWFQIHRKWSFTREHRFNHWEWLQEEHPFPIYMQRAFDDVPMSDKYPLREIQKELIHIVRGELPIKKVFGSTFDYAMALALREGFERIELYGIEMLLEGEYAHQRETMSFWLGKADGMGVDVWLPEQSSLLLQPLYGYEETRKGDTGEVMRPPDDYEGD